MGGCRCSFRGCRSVSDNRTHFFHYPIRDKVRCLKWMLNAGTGPEFRKLSGTQLKNKVVCEFHFVDQCFMSKNHDRLVHDAIPTECGPYYVGTAKPADEVDKNSALCKETIPSANNTESTDVETTDVSSTTLAVAESPVLGLAFYSKDNDVKKPRDAQAYTEVLTRKTTGMVDILKRKLLETSQHRKPKSTSTIQQRCSKRNVDKVYSPTKEYRKEETSLVTRETILKKKKIREIINNDANTQSNNNNTISQVLDKAIELSSTNCGRVLHNDIQIENTIPNTGIHTKSDKEGLPEVIIVPVEDDAKFLANNLICGNEIRYATATPSAIIFRNDGDIITTSHNTITSNQNITVLENKSIPLSFSNLDSDGSSTVSNNVMRMIERNSREIIELKNLIANKQSDEEQKRRKMYTTTRRKRILTHRDQYIRKLELYTNIVQHLSPKVAKLVYKDMFT